MNRLTRILTTGVEADGGNLPLGDVSDVEVVRLLRLEGGIKSVDRADGTGTFNKALYTRCIACEEKKRLSFWTRLNTTPLQYDHSFNLLKILGTECLLLCSV